MRSLVALAVAVVVLPAAAGLGGPAPQGGCSIACQALEQVGEALGPYIPTEPLGEGNIVLRSRVVLAGCAPSLQACESAAELVLEQELNVGAPYPFDICGPTALLVSPFEDSWAGVACFQRTGAEDGILVSTSAVGGVSLAGPVVYADCSDVNGDPAGWIGFADTMSGHAALFSGAEIDLQMGGIAAKAFPPGEDCWPFG
jgi:hypothetical protein